MNLKPYPEYKDSSVAWLGKVPRHWEMRKLKYLSKINPSIKTIDNASTRVSFVPMERTRENYPFFNPENREYQEVRTGFTCFQDNDVLIAKITPCFENGKGGICRNLVNGIGFGSTEFHVIRTDSALEKVFFYYLTISKSFRNYGAENMQGSAGQKRVPTDFIKNLLLAFPSISEQLAIARFLDYKTVQIARFIKAKRRMIELLKEQKQVIINDAVTGKIVIKDEGGRLKAEKRPDSSFTPHSSSFLQTMPEGWEVRPIKQIVFFNPSKSETGFSSKSSENVVFLPMENVSVDGRINCSIKRPYKDVCNGFSYFKKGDVVIAKITPCFENGKGAYLDELETECGFGTTEFITIRPSSKIGGKLLRFILSSNWFLKIGEKYMTGSAGQKRISSDFIKNFPLGVPSLEEQSQIVSYIETKTAAVDLAISRTEREITLMQEYRTRLVSDVVTGKIDVRAIEIPDIADIDDTIDESIDEPEGEEELETAEAEE